MTFQLEIQPKPTSTQRSPRYVFLAEFKARDTISGMQVEGLTADLSEGGCCVMARRAPFSPGTPIRLEIRKDGDSLETDATVIYNLKDQILGIHFAEMAAQQQALLAKWIKAASAARRAKFD
jgi:hypothetical protein